MAYSLETCAEDCCLQLNFKISNLAHYKMGYCSNIACVRIFFLVEREEIDLFSFYVLFSHFRPRDATRGNSFFQMSSYARANVRTTNERTKGKFP